MEEEVELTAHERGKLSKDCPCYNIIMTVDHLGL